MIRSKDTGARHFAPVFLAVVRRKKASLYTREPKRFSFSERQGSSQKEINMKKLLTIALALFMLIGLCACNAPEKQEQNTEPSILNTEPSSTNPTFIVEGEVLPRGE